MKYSRGLFIYCLWFVVVLVVHIHLSILRVTGIGIRRVPGIGIRRCRWPRPSRTNGHNSPLAALPEHINVK